MPQLDSLSLSGAGQASVLVGRRGEARELRLTIDGGKTWQVIESQATGKVLEGATFLDRSKGWVVNRDGQVFGTNSGGANWTKLGDLKALSNGDFIGASEIKFVTENDGWIKEFLSIWRTADGGVSWRNTLSVLTPGVDGQPGKIYPLDVNTLVSIGEGQVYLTRDGGANWKIQTLIADNAAFTDVWFADKQHGWISGYIGEPSFRPLLFATKDGGESWVEIPVAANNRLLPSSICFVGQEEGWLAGRVRPESGRPVLSEAVLFHTNDAGKRWLQVQLSAVDPFFSEVRFTDKEHGWLVGRDNLYSTQDAGKTWQRVLSLPPIQPSAKPHTATTD